MGNIINTFPKVPTNSRNERSEDLYFVGEAKSVQPRFFADAVIPRNPGLAANNFGSPHSDSYCSESVGLDGPCTPVVRVIRQRNPYGYTPCMVCNEANQMIGVSFNWTQARYYLVVFDTHANMLSATPLSFKSDGSFAGGYFFLDRSDHTIVVSQRSLICFDTRNVSPARAGRNPVPTRWTSADLTTDSAFPQLAGNKPYSAMPVWGEEENLFWVLFAGKCNLDKPVPYESPCAMAVVQIVENTKSPGGCDTIIHSAITLDAEWNNNTFSVDACGAYFVTNAVEQTADGLVNAQCGYLYHMRYDTKAKEIFVKWRVPYESCGFLKEGQKNIGSGTTPTLMDDGDARYVSITDNASPHMNVCVYDRADGALLSKTPVFSAMRSANEASVIGVGRTVIAESNYGHIVTYPNSQTVPIEPGMTRIDVARDGTDAVRNGTVSWTDERTSFLAMSMLARESGIVFAHTADWSGPESATHGAMYYVCAIDACTGRTIWRVPMGRGVEFCHDYGGVYFNRDGNLFIGSANYIVSVQKEKRGLGEIGEGFGAVSESVQNA